MVKVAILNKKDLEFDYTDKRNNKTHRKIQPLNVEDNWAPNASAPGVVLPKKR